MTFRQHQLVLRIPTRPKGFVDITKQVARAVDESGVRTGMCHLFLRHTSAGLLIQENADPDVLRDFAAFFAHLVPEDFAYRHTTEGPDDMPAHIRTALTRTSESIPVDGGRLSLGTWQAIYVWEHRAHSHEREVVVHVVGEGGRRGEDAGSRSS